MRRVLAVTVLLAGVALMLSTGALAPGGDRVGDVVLEPTSPYATTENTSTGPQIELSFGDAETGLNPDAITTFDSVFAIHNRGNESAAVYIEDAPVGLTFHSGGAPLTEANARTVAPNGSIPVSVVVDTTRATTGEDDFSVVAEPATPAPDDPQVTVIDRGTDTLVVTIDGATADRQPVPITERAGSEAEASLTRIAVDTTGPTRLTVTPTMPDGTIGVADADTELLGAVDVNANTTIEDARVVFTVDAAQLADGTPVGFHETADGWETADTTVLTQTGDTATIAVDVQHFSMVALGVAPAEPADTTPSGDDDDTETSADPDEDSAGVTPPTDDTTGSGLADEDTQPRPSEDTDSTLQAPTTATAPTIEESAVGLRGGLFVLGAVLVVLSVLVLARRHLS